MCVCVLRSSEAGWRDEERRALVSRRQRTAGEEIGRPARHAVITSTPFPRQPCHLCVWFPSPSAHALKSEDVTRVSNHTSSTTKCASLDAVVSCRSSTHHARRRSDTTHGITYRVCGSGHVPINEDVSLVRYCVLVRLCSARDSAE